MSSKLTIGEKIKQVTTGRIISEIEELILDGAKGTTITGLSDDYVSLSQLSLNSVGLTSFEGLPKLPELFELEASDNKISGGLEIIVNNCPALGRLNLSGNRIKNIDDLKCLQDLSSLSCLDLYNCDVTLLPDYREKVYKLLPKLHVLDGWDSTNKEADIDDEDSDGSSSDGNANNEDEDDDDEEDEEESYETDDYNDGEDEEESNEAAELEAEEVPFSKEVQEKKMNHNSNGDVSKDKVSRSRPACSDDESNNNNNNNNNETGDYEDEGNRKHTKRSRKSGD